MSLIRQPITKISNPLRRLIAAAGQRRQEAAAAAREIAADSKSMLPQLAGVGAFGLGVALAKAQGLASMDEEDYYDPKLPHGTFKI